MTAPWCVIEGETFVCKRCGTRYRMSFPTSPRIVAAVSRAFLADHRRCKETSP